ncbi:MAG: hypothetical protein OIF55_05880, partial [Amphritea sp.]|nr:hypothetical protein [Amphritea sp.]
QSCEPKFFNRPSGFAVAGIMLRYPLADFQPIPIISLPEIADQMANDLSIGQQLLFGYSRPVVTGAVGPELARAMQNHSRWKTMAIRELVLHARKTEPTRALVSGQ